MNTELMRRLWIKLNCWPETVSLQKNKKRKKKLPPISCLFSSSRSSVWVKMKGGTMQKVRWVVCRTFTAPHHCLRTNCCAKLDPLLKSSNGNVLCVCVTKIRPLLKANYSIVMYRVVSGQNAPIVWVIQLDWNAQFYTKKVYENFVCRSNRLRVHHPQTSYLSFFSTQIFSTQIFLHIDLALKRHQLW